MSQEYNKILRCGPQLSKAFQSHLPALPSALLKKHLITGNNVAEVNNIHVGLPDRAAKLLGFIRNKVSLNKHCYYEFVDALKEDEDDQFNDILQILGEAPTPAANRQQNEERPRFSEADMKEILQSKEPQNEPSTYRAEIEIYVSKVLVLIHTIKEEELVAVYKYLKPPIDGFKHTIKYYATRETSLILGKFGNHDAAVVQTEKSVDCADGIRKALKKLPNVKLIIGVGFAYGKKEKCKFGDVLVSKIIYDVKSTRLEKEGVRPEGGHAMIDMDRVVNIFVRGTLTHRFESVTADPVTRKPKVFADTIMSGPNLVNNPQTVGDILKHDARSVGGEMEGSVVAKCVRSFCKENEGREIDYVIIKGVADYGDGTKGKPWQFTASLAAADYADHRLEKEGGKVYYLTALENHMHYEAYKSALRDGLVLTMHYLKFLFFGPPRTGKTTARRRLVHEIINLSVVNEPSISTGMSERNDVIVKLKSEQVAVASSEWIPMTRSKDDRGQETHNEETSDRLTKLFYWLISKEMSSKPKDSVSDPATVSEPISNVHVSISEDVTDEHNIIESHVMESPELQRIDVPGDLEFPAELSSVPLSKDELMAIDEAFKKLTTALQSDTLEDLHKLLKDLIMINMEDIGGQPAFLELCSAFTTGPALYFIFFRLDQKLKKVCNVDFQKADGCTVHLKRTYCTETVIHQLLSSIICFGSTSISGASEMSARALLFGTYKDEAEKNNISIHQLDSELKKQFLPTKICEKDLLLKTTGGKMFYSLDNLNGDDSEMIPIREDIENIIKECFPPIPIPASWLMFRMILKYLSKPVVSLNHCKEIAKHLSMKQPVEEAIWFFHHNIGNLMHYPDISSMKDIVICDTQVVFESTTELIIDTFQHKNRYIGLKEIEDFVNKGQFSLACLQKKAKRCQHTHLSPEQLTDLLKSRNIIAEIKSNPEQSSQTHHQESSAQIQHHQKSLSQVKSSCKHIKADCDSSIEITHNQESSSSQCNPKFIMPAVLEDATEEELKPVTSTDLETVSPLMIQFKGGFVPFGVFCAGIASLIARQHSLEPKWYVVYEDIKKNKVKFHLESGYCVTLISRPQYFEIQVSKLTKRQTFTRSLEETCLSVQEIVVDTIDTVVSQMKYKMLESQISTKQLFSLAFLCDPTDDNRHLFALKEKNSKFGYCSNCVQYVELEHRHTIWFNHMSKESSQSTNSSDSNNSVEEKPLTLVPVKTKIKEKAVKVTKDVTTSALSTAAWDLPGVDVCGEMTVVLHSSAAQQITWEGFGLKLHLDEGSLPLGIDQCTLTIKASLAGQYEFPDNSYLVSAIIWLRCEPMCKFTKPVTLKMQHCARSENVANLKLKFVRAVCNQKQLPYTFNELGGDFTSHSSYGVVEVKGFCGMAITQGGSEKRKYCSQLFHFGPPSSCHIHFIVTWDVEAHLTAVKQEYANEGAIRGPCQPVYFESDTITLDIPIGGISIQGRTITPLMQPIVTKDQVDDFNAGKLTPHCELLATVSTKTVPILVHRVNLLGAKPPNNFLYIILPAFDYMLQQAIMHSQMGMYQAHYIQGYNSIHHMQPHQLRGHINPANIRAGQPTMAGRMHQMSIPLQMDTAAQSQMMQWPEMVGGAYPQYNMVAGQPPPSPHETMLTATQPQMLALRPQPQHVSLMQQQMSPQHMQVNAASVSPIPGQQQLCSAPTPPLFVAGAQQQQHPASFGSEVSTRFGGQSQQLQTQQALALQQQYMAQAPSAGGSSTTAQPLGQQQQQTSVASVGSSGQAQMPDPIPYPIRVVKPGSIKEPDRLFNQLAKEIGDKYKQVGIDLGLTFQNQQNALETGPYANAQADQRALKMLNLWQKQSPDKDFTYSILATALENNSLQRSADKYCYMDPPGSQ